jgi:alkylated DNA repair dioxygenase AlkB
MPRLLDPTQIGLFDAPVTDARAPRRLEMPGADVRFWADFLSPAEAASTFAALRAIAPFKQDRRMMYDQLVDVPRLSTWYGAEGPWPAPLAALLARIEAVTGHAYDKVLFNLYRDGRDSVAWHRDDTDRFGQDEIIASLSLGATRRFLFRPRAGREGAPFGLALESGSLLLMGGGTQSHWEHCVPKSHRLVGERLNLTFRRSAGLSP